MIAKLRERGNAVIVVSHDMQFVLDYADRIQEIRSTAVEHGRDPDAIELTVWPGSYRYGSAFDIDLARRYADLGVTRFVVAAQEASGDSFDDLRRFLSDYQDQVLTRL